MVGGVGSEIFGGVGSEMVRGVAAGLVRGIGWKSAVEMGSGSCSGSEWVDEVLVCCACSRALSVVVLLKPSLW